MTELGHAVFREEQQFRQTWLWVLLVATLGVPVPLLLSMQRDVPTGPLLAIVLGAGALPLALFWFARLEVEVRTDGLYYRFLPFHLGWQRLAWGEIATHAAVTYRPLVEYGGWGVRGLPGNRAYNVSGDRGVRLALRNGRRILLGSQRADELDLALTTAMKSRA